MPKINNNDTIHSHSDLVTGEIPQDVQVEIIKRLEDTNIIMKFGRLEATTELVKTIAVSDGKMVVNKVGEAERINASKITNKLVRIVADKYASIAVYTNEYISWTDPDFRENFITEFVRAFNEKTNTEFLPQLLESATTAGHVVDGDLNAETIQEALQYVMDNFDDDSMVALFSNSNKMFVKTLADSVAHVRYFDPEDNTFLGVDTEFLQSIAKGTAYVLSGENAIAYIFPKNIQVEYSNSAQISSIKNDDGSPFNTFEQDSVALRAVYYFGAEVLAEDAIAVISKTVTPDPEG